MDRSYFFKAGTAPLVISIPHLGTEIPDSQRAGMTPAAEQLADTDWHLDRLYDFADALGASVLRARYSRYVIDLNRPPDDAHLYPGQAKTGLCPTDTFRGEPLYKDGAGPSADEQKHRLDTYWRPYHAKLADELARVRQAHGAVLLWDAHSIASRLPRLFDGKLPDLNIGTANGASCSPLTLEAVHDVLRGCPYSFAINGRFKGGHITRHYGAPAEGIQAIQLEMCQSVYMSEDPPFNYSSELADRVKPVIEALVQAALRSTVSGVASR